MVSLLLTFNDSNFKKVYELLTKSWLTEEELEALVDAGCVAECLTILKKGSLVEEQWRMPGPGESPKKEYKTTYNKFRANFQCSMQDLADIMYVATSTDEILRDLVDRMEEEVRLGNTSINDLARKFGVSPVCVKALAKRIPYLDVRGQGLVLLDRPDR